MPIQRKRPLPDGCVEAKPICIQGAESLVRLQLQQWASVRILEQGCVHMDIHLSLDRAEQLSDGFNFGQFALTAHPQLQVQRCRTPAQNHRCLGIRARPDQVQEPHCQIIRGVLEVRCVVGSYRTFSHNPRQLTPVQKPASTRHLPESGWIEPVKPKGQLGPPF